MTDENITHLNDDNFKAGVASGITLVDFHAEWCGPCRMLAPVLSKVAQDVKGKAKIAKLDIDHAQQIASQYQVTSVPTLILFKSGMEVGRLVGLRDAAAVKDFILSAK